MKKYAVKFAPEISGELADIFNFIAQRGAPEAAARFTQAIITYCEEMCFAPHRGVQRDDLRPGLRITNFKGTPIAFTVDEAMTTVSILGVFYGGQDYESVLFDDE